MQLAIPPQFKGNVVALLTEIEQLQVEPDLAAKIVIDERSGIIVMGRDVRVVHRRGGAGQPHRHDLRERRRSASRNPLSRGRHRGGAAHAASACSEDGKKFARRASDGVSLQQLVDGLNALGIGPRDLIGILQAIKAAGAIQADIEVM